MALASIASKVSGTFRRFGPTTSLVIISQASSSISLFLLPMLGLGTSDTYSTAIQVGTGTFNGLIMGVLYLLAIGRPDFNAWRQAHIAAFSFSLVLAAVAAVTLLKISHFEGLPSRDVLSIIAAFGLGGAFLASTGVEGVRQACRGRPLLLAGATIPANMAMAFTTMCLTLFYARAPWAPLVPASVWMMSNACVAIYSALRSRTSPDGPDTMKRPAGDPESRGNVRLHLAGLLLGVVISTVYPIAFVSAVSQLQRGSATILFLVSRIGSAAIGILINSVLLVRHSWSQAQQEVGSFSYRMMAAAVLLMALGVVLHATVQNKSISYFPVAAAWLACLSATPFVLRETNRRRMGRNIFAKSATDAILSSIALLFLFRSPTITGYFSVYSISQCVTCIICAQALGDRNLLRFSLAGAVLAGFLLMKGW